MPTAAQIAPVSSAFTFTGLVFIMSSRRNASRVSSNAMDAIARLKAAKTGDGKRSDQIEVRTPTHSAATLPFEKTREWLSLTLPTFVASA